MRKGNNPPQLKVNPELGLLNKINKETIFVKENRQMELQQLAQKL